MTTKIMALTDALGNLTDFRLLPGQTHDLRGTADLIEGLDCGQFDRDTYKWRHLIEHFFGKLKEYRGIAMRCCKTDASFRAFIAIAATVIRTR